MTSTNFVSVHNGFNLTVDSNDDGALDWDDDLFEEQPPGKLIGVNDGDADSDGITDFADFSTIGAAFVPLHFASNGLRSPTGRITRAIESHPR